MANKKIAKVVKAAKRVGRRAVRTVRRMAAGDELAQLAQLDLPAIKAAEMLADPCNAELAPGCYRGDQGFKNRFVSTASYGTTAGNTVLALAYVPSQNSLFVASAATSGATATWANISGPGGVFLVANASAIRSLGACLTVTPNSANLATSGQVYTGIVSQVALNLNVSDVPDQLIQLCNVSGKIGIDEPMECKWIPSANDERYNVVGQQSDTSDSSVVLMLFVGYPAAAGFTVRATNIVEWKPRPNIGISTESFLGNPSRNTIEHVKTALLKRDKHWYTNVAKGAYSVLRGYLKGGYMGAASAAVGQFTK